MRTGTVYTETVVHIGEPYQVVIVTLDEGGRATGRTADSERLSIDDRVVETESPNDIPHFRKLL